MNEWPVDKVPQEEFVTAGNRSRKVTKGESGSVLVGVWPFVASSDNNADHVQTEGNGVILRCTDMSSRSHLRGEQLTTR